MTDTQDKNSNPVKSGESHAVQPKPLSHLEARRAQNLRDNLLRRKQQAKARQENDASDSGPREGM